MQFGETTASKPKFYYIVYDMYIYIEREREREINKGIKKIHTIHC